MADDDNQFEFLFTENSKDLDEAFAKIEAQSADLADTVSGHFDETGEAASGAASHIADYAAATGDAAAASGKVNPQLQGTGKHLLEIGGEASGAAEGFKGLAEMLGVTEGLLHRVSGAFRGISPEFAETLNKGAEAAAGAEAQTGLLASAMEALTNPIGIAIVVLLGYTAAVTGAAFALKEMAESATEEGNQLFLMSQKTGISVQNLGALEVGAELAGTSLQRITLAVTLLQSRMERSSNSTKGQGKALHDLHLDTQDANHALVQLFEHIAKLPTPMARTQEAIKLMGFRMGRDFGQVVTEMGGSIEKFDEMLAGRHITLGKEEAEQAHEFTKELILLDKEWENLKRQIEFTATPIVKNWIQDISVWLMANHDTIREWGTSFVETLASIVPKVEAVVNVLKDIYHIYQLLSALAPINIEINIIKKIIESTAGPKDGDIRTTPGMRGSQGTQDWVYENGQWVIASKASGTAQATAAAFDANKIRPTSHGGGGGGGGGGDPFQHALKMEQERLKQTLAGFAREDDQWSEMLKRKMVSMESFTAMAVQLEESRHKATVEGYKVEEDAAKKLKKPEAREEKLLELVGKRAEEEYRYAKAIRERTFAEEDELENRRKARESGINSLHQVTAQQEETRITDLARHRIITEEDAGREIEAIQERMLSERESILRRAMSREEVLHKPGDEFSSSYIKSQLELASIEAQRAANQETGTRRRRDDRLKDLAGEREYIAGLRSLDADILSTRINSANVLLEHQINTGKITDTNTIRNFRTAIARVEENARYEDQILAIHEQQRVDLIDKQGAEIEEINDRYRKKTEAAEESHAIRMKSINEQWIIDLHNALGQLADTAANDITNAIAEGFENGVGAGVRSFERGILEMIQGALMNRLKKELLAIFDDLAGRGGIIGKIFEILTGVKKPTQGTGTVTSTVTGGTSIDAAKEVAANAVKTSNAITIATANQTKDLNLARVAQTREIDNALQQATEHLCQCLAPQQQGFWSTVLSAAVGAAITSGLSGGGGGNRAYEGPDTGPVKTPPVLKSGHYEGGNFSLGDAFPVGERGPEMVYTNQHGGFVVPSTSRGGTSGGEKTVNITLNAPVLGGSSHSAPKSRREYIEMLAPALKEALSGV